MNEKISGIILGSLIADTYSLGAHWVYSQVDLETNNLDWEELNDPIALWHKTKQKGEFTHYGDQTVCLYEYIKKENKFEPNDFIKVWQAYMTEYDGYIDSATRETLENILKEEEEYCGAISDDLSIIGRISPLLLISKKEKDFLKHVDAFVLLTHNSELAQESAEFFAKVLWAVYSGGDIMDSVKSIKESFSQRIKTYVNTGLNSPLDTFDAIREFGPACGIQDGFPGVIYILNKYGDDFKMALIQNAKAGGDSSARGMIIAMLLVAAHGKEIIPQNWVEQMNYKGID